MTSEKICTIFESVIHIVYFYIVILPPDISGIFLPFQLKKWHPPDQTFDNYRNPGSSVGSALTC